MRTAIGLFHFFHSVSVHFRVFHIYLTVSSVSVTEKKNVSKKNLHGFCAVYIKNPSIMLLGIFLVTKFKRPYLQK